MNWISWNGARPRGPSGPPPKTTCPNWIVISDISVIPQAELYTERRNYAKVNKVASFLWAKMMANLFQGGIPGILSLQPLRSVTKLHETL
jgi:hypothetical protein